MGKTLTIHFVDSEKTLVVSDCDIQELDNLQFTGAWVIKSTATAPAALINMQHVAWVELSQGTGKEAS